MRRKLETAVTVLRSTWQEWRRDNAMMLAAAVAFYATFSVAPLLVLLLNAAALLLGQAAARARLLDLVADAAGARAARAVGRLIVTVSKTDAGATALSVVLLVVAASAVFRHLKFALNLVFDVPTKEMRGWVRFLRRRAFAAVIAIAGILLLVTALATSAAIEWIGANVPEALRYAALWRGVDLAVSFAMLTVVFGSILKFVPDVDLKWRHVGVGAVLAALAFTVGQMLIGLYLSRSNLTSAYGAAGSVVLLLVYFYLTAAILFAAAELTEVFARRDAEFREERRDRQDEQQYTPRKQAQ